MKSEESNISSIFGYEDENDDSSGTMNSRNQKNMSSNFNKPICQKSKLSVKSKAVIEDALAMDPNIFDYDNSADNCKKDGNKASLTANNKKKSKYIENMKVASFRRQLENERHMERKLQRERQEEKEQNLSDVEEFVTSAYKAKLEEFSELNELEMLEAQNSKFSAVENQADVSAIHKYYMDQKYGTPSVEVKETQKCLANEDNESSEDEENNKSSEEEIKQSKNVPRKSKKVIIVEDDEESEEDRIAREKTIAVRKFGRRCIGEKFIEAQQAYLQRKSLDLVKPIVESE